MLRIEIQNLINASYYDSSYIYLLKVLNENSAFLYNEKKVYFAIKNILNLNSESIDTTNLSLRTNVFINSVENNPSFKPGYYNILFFNNDLNSDLFSTFVDLCTVYSSENNTKDFISFFYSLITLFQLPKEENFRNLIGFYGELKLIQILFEKYSLDISNSWHKTGSSFDKYDFVFQKINLEVKTSTKEENIFKIKHNQIFNDHNNYVALLNINLDNSGETVVNLLDYFKLTKPFSNNLDFLIKLEREKTKINFKESNKTFFKFYNLSFFHCNDLEKITNIPSAITNISYNYNFESQTKTDIKKLLNFLV